jgi:hypothetical protein
MKHKNMKRLAAAAAVAVLSLGAAVIPTSSAQADTGWPLGSNLKIHGPTK